MEHHYSNKEKGSRTFFGWVGKTLIVAVVLVVVSLLTPGFSIRGMWSFLIAAVVISALDYLAERFMGVDASPFGKGLTGFLISVVIIYLTQFFVPNMSVSILGAILGALVIGILDAVFPSKVL